MKESSQGNPKEILRNYVTGLAEISNLTLEMTDRQVPALRKFVESSRKFDEASKGSDFWKNAVKGLDSVDVATFFVTLTKLPEMGEGLTKFGTLKEEEQDTLLKKYKETTHFLNELGSVAFIGAGNPPCCVAGAGQGY
jgi:hypothetical protein